ncbi:alpha/beta-hydrolase [Xylariaceae sp. FL0804]|nr:alpha/beta-hydrolase [Xylariaceae sp. FL0804]
MSTPVIVVVPGSFSPPAIYNDFLAGIREKGYEVKALHLPTVGLGPGRGRDGPAPPMEEDAAFIAEEVGKLADAGKNVVLLAHSYGGLPASQCTKGLSLREREQQGKRGGIVRIAYLTAVVPALGKSFGETLADFEGSEFPTKIEADENGWLYFVDLDQAAANVGSDLPHKDARAIVDQFARHSAASFQSPLTHAGHKDIPVSFLLCENNLTVSPLLQRAEIQKIEKESGNKVDVTSIPTGHVPTVSAREVVVDWIVQAASKT